MSINFVRYPFHYLYVNIIHPRISNFRYFNILSKNLELKNSMEGKRAFIIGGGPSLKNINLAKLKDEQTFALNEFDQNPKFNEVLPKNYLIIDSSYYTLGDDHYLTEQFQKKGKSLPEDTVLFINVSAKNFIEKNKMFTGHKLYYVAMEGIYSDKLPLNIDIDEVVPRPKNSILMALVIATYMGFEEIYLLGCEHNFLSMNIGSKKFTYEHSYNDPRANIDPNDTELIKKYTNPRDLTLTYEKQIMNVKQLFKNYRLFWQKVQKEHPKTKIYNATPDSFLDVFPKIDFDKIPLK
ncbi:hypothetical protein D4R52_02135 [bacterium]|nr:MAG: hypothetical protein D4R52_02135 [bacterium]